MTKALNKIKMSRGFTLADMMVATAIIVTISVVLMVNFRVGRQRDELRNTGLLIASVLRQAQAYTLAGRTINGVYPVGGYGISINSGAIYIFANEVDDRSFSNGGELWQEEYNLSDYNTYIDSAMCVKTDTNNCWDPPPTAIEYYFLPPQANRTILGYIINQGSFEFVLRHADLSGKGMRISSNAVTGQILLGPVEDIP